MVDIVGAEKCTPEDLESSSEPASTASNKSPTDAALRISFILAGIVATVCILCVVSAAYSMHHHNDIFSPAPERSSLVTPPQHK
jgi:ABC-type spermidine/putrescine transport system permease subunit II